MTVKNKESLKAKYDHLKDANAERAFFYRLLSGVFLSEPDPSILELLNDSDVSSTIRRKGASFDEAISLINKFVEDTEANGEDPASKVREDFMANFCFGKNQIYPYESVYVSKKKMLFQDATIAVRNWYFDYDLAPRMLYSDPDDHIGLELDFLVHLSERLTKALEKKNVEQAKNLIEAQARFLKEHPLKWFDKFADQVALKARSDFYRGFATILREYVKDDLDNLKEQYIVLESIGRLELVSDQKEAEKVEIQ